MKNFIRPPGVLIFQRPAGPAGFPAFHPVTVEASHALPSVLFLLLSALLAAGSETEQAIVILQPGSTASAVRNGDTFVTPGPSGSLAQNNYGGAGALAVAGSGSRNGHFSAVLRFDTAQVKMLFDGAYGAGGWQLQSAVLYLVHTRANNPLFNAPVPGRMLVQWTADDSWVEGSGNPNTPGPTGLNFAGFAALLAGAESAGTFLVPDPGDGMFTEFPLSPTPGMQADAAAGEVMGFVLTAADPGMAALFNSRSFAASSRNPALTLTAVPLLPEITALRPVPPDGGFLLEFTSPAAFPVRAQISRDLEDWQDQPPFFAQPGINSIPIHPAPAAGSWFCRLERIFP